MSERQDMLKGFTYKVEYDNPYEESNADIYLIINEQDDKPFEIFFEYKNARLHEWIVLTTVLMTWLLREGVSLDKIITELKEIHSPFSKHFRKGNDKEVPSLVAGIGEVLEQHIKMRELYRQREERSNDHNNT